jgi:uncharacterized membrane protein YfcA
MNAWSEWLPAELSITAALILLATSFLTSGVSATFGLGGGVAMLIALLSFTSPIIALPLHAIIQLGSTTSRSALLRKHIIFEIVWWFVPGIILGILIAMQVLVTLDTTWLQSILAVFIMWSVWAPKLNAKAISVRTYFGVGTATSFATMFLGATGPLVAAFITPERYGRDATVATHAACMTMQHVIKAIAFGFLGFAFFAWIPLIVAMLFSGFAGSWLGGLLLRRIPEHIFKICFKLVLTALALRLLVTALM